MVCGRDKAAAAANDFFRKFLLEIFMMAPIQAYFPFF
jgi:hypothetical protein